MFRNTKLLGISVSVFSIWAYKYNENTKKNRSPTLYLQYHFSEII